MNHSIAEVNNKQWHFIPIYALTSSQHVIILVGGKKVGKKIEEMTIIVKAAVHGKCKQLECLHLQAYKKNKMNELFPLE